MSSRVPGGRHGMSRWTIPTAPRTVDHRELTLEHDVADLPRQRARPGRARTRRVGVRRRRPRATSSTLVRARPGRAPLALAGRRHRDRARDRDGLRPARPSESSIASFAPTARSPSSSRPSAPGGQYTGSGGPAPIPMSRRLPRGSRSKGRIGLRERVGGPVESGTGESEHGKRPPAVSMRSRTCGRRERSSRRSASEKPMR